MAKTTTEDMPASKVLKGALAAKPKHAIVLTTDAKGRFVAYGTTSDPKRLKRMVEKFRAEVLAA